VGKTTVSVNLAVALQAMGHRVMLFDADMSLANAQIALGCRCPYNLSHFLSGEKTLAEIIVTTRQGVKLVPGASGIQEMAALGDIQAANIVRAFSALDDDIDFLIVDMAAGISPEVLAFMAACSRRFCGGSRRPILHCRCLCHHQGAHTRPWFGRNLFGAQWRWQCARGLSIV
jgi:flagellar biosynthesis protein FlhG